MDWLRWWHGTVTDPKFQWVARKSGQGLGNVLAVWAALLECASNATQCNADATRGNVASFDCNDFDVLLDIEDGCVQKIYDAMAAKNLIQDGRLTQWEIRQPKREDSGNPSTGALSSTERSRLRRDKLKRDATDGNAMQRDATDGNDREDEIREEVNLTTSNEVVVANASGVEQHLQCPHQKIIDLYHEVLPMCPRVRDWTPARATQLRARWNEEKKRQNLDFWKRLFEYVAQSEFLTGRTTKPFFADLEWITKTSNFTKIREGKYENRA